MRVATRFLAAIEGIDAEPSPHVGNISATGAYFETTGDPIARSCTRRHVVQQGAPAHVCVETLSVQGLAER